MLPDLSTGSLSGCSIYWLSGHFSHHPWAAQVYLLAYLSPSGIEYTLEESSSIIGIHLRVAQWKNESPAGAMPSLKQTKIQTNNMKPKTKTGKEKRQAEASTAGLCSWQQDRSRNRVADHSLPWEEKESGGKEKSNLGLPLFLPFILYFFFFFFY